MALSPMTLASRELDEVRKVVAGRIASLREQLERDTPHDVTTRLRGRLTEAKELLALLTAAPAQAPTPHGAVGFVGDMPVFSPPPTHGD